MKKRPKPKLKNAVPETGFLTVYLAIYRLTAVITWGTKAKEILQYAKDHNVTISESYEKEFLQEFDIPKPTGRCMNLGDGNNDILVWIKGRPQHRSHYSVLYHELYHAVDYISKSHGLRDELEARAYIFEYLVNECNNYFWPK